jgi:hypothetical protein
MVYRDAITVHFSKIVLTAAAVFSFIFLLSGFILSLKFLKGEFHSNKPLLWFFPALIIIPLVSSWICAGLLNTLPAVKYFAVYNALFLILISAFICKVFKNKRWGVFVSVILIISLYISRMPHATAKEIDADNAASFLYKEAFQGDVIICMRSCPQNAEDRKIIQIANYLKLDDAGTRYEVISKDAWSELKGRIAPFRRVFFYKAYGNVEIFGANRIIEDFIYAAGFKAIFVEKFRSIDIVKYEK